ncbi:MAG: hypothetical protein KDB27_27430 [Planctomycetales bacterium]|nr:hypothetical protein [Planctomycetales bacterium]
MMRQLVRSILLAALAAVPAPASIVLSDPSVGSISLVTPPDQQVHLGLIDGLAFDQFGNLFGTLEVSDTSGGVVWIDKSTGNVTSMVTGISRADQLSFALSGHLFVSSEVTPASTTNRIYDVQIGYIGSTPDPATTSLTSLTTSLSIDNPEGLVVLNTTNGFGDSGDMIVAEDGNPGRLLKVLADGTTSEIVTGLARPEGVALGRFAGDTVDTVYVAETSNNRVLRIDSSANVSVVGDPTSVSLTAPDNVRIGPDGYLYITEDRPSPNSRVVRVAPDGTFSVLATGFGQASGMAFDPSNGDMYIAEQDFSRVWRIEFSSVPEPSLIPIWCAGGLLIGICFMVKERKTESKTPAERYLSA